MTASRWPRFEFLDKRGRMHRFRSRWELAFATALDATETLWDYEPDRLLLSTGQSYTPDFRIGNRYVEIKGWAGWTASIAKAYQAQRDGYDIELIVGREAFDAACEAASKKVFLT